jgi:mycothiol synthase
MDLRAATREDDEAVLRVLAARDLADFGVDDLSRELLLDQWRVPQFDSVRDAVIAHDGSDLLGYAAARPPGGLAFVDPAHEGRGVGTALLGWLERTRGCRRQRVGAGNDAARQLLTAAGYEHARSIIYMERELGDAPPPSAAPAGIAILTLELDRDGPLLPALDAAAFADSTGYQPEPADAFAGEHLTGPSFEPRLSRVARRGSSLVGFTACRRPAPGLGVIDLLAVDPSERRQGLATALMTATFEAFRAAGLDRARLDVESDNEPGLRLYRRLGMEPRYEAAVFKRAEP